MREVAELMGGGTFVAHHSQSSLDLLQRIYFALNWNDCSFNFTMAGALRVFNVSPEGLLSLRSGWVELILLCLVYFGKIKSGQGWVGLG